MPDSEAAEATARPLRIPLSFSRGCLFEEPTAREAAAATTAGGVAGGVAVADGSAVDDSEDLPDDDVDEAKETSSYSARRGSGGGAGGRFARVREVLPFAFHPNVRPLSISDLESCVVLENAAFEDPEHRCTREKVSFCKMISLCYLLLCVFVWGYLGWM